jgi:hypothetical protein
MIKQMDDMAYPWKNGDGSKYVAAIIMNNRS